MIPDIEQVYEELNIKSDQINITFNVNNYKFAIRKRGLIRKKIAASKFIMAYQVDGFGIMEGKYDNAIENIMGGVSYVGDPSVDLSGAKFWDWVETLSLEDANGDVLQRSMLETLPQAVAAVIVGKFDFQKMIQQLMILSGHTQPQENQNTTSKEKDQESVQKLKEPVRTSPKVVKPSG